jgi:hypothetical protein
VTTDARMWGGPVEPPVRPLSVRFVPPRGKHLDPKGLLTMMDPGDDAHR